MTLLFTNTSTCINKPSEYWSRPSTGDLTLEEEQGPPKTGQSDRSRSGKNKTPNDKEEMGAKFIPVDQLDDYIEKALKRKLAEMSDSSDESSSVCRSVKKLKTQTSKGKGSIRKVEDDKLVITCPSNITMYTQALNKIRDSDGSSDDSTNKSPNDSLNTNSSDNSDIDLFLEKERRKSSDHD